MENKATKRTNRLGRGLSALIPDISTEIDKKDISGFYLINLERSLVHSTTYTGTSSWQTRNAIVLLGKKLSVQ